MADKIPALMHPNPLEYIDTCIEHWRDVRDNDKDEEQRYIAVYYIDAFQSMRLSLYGLLLPVKEEQ